MMAESKEGSDVFKMRIATGITAQMEFCTSALTHLGVVPNPTNWKAATRHLM
jgi:hypothetical protein